MAPSSNTSSVHQLTDPMLPSPHDGNISPPPSTDGDGHSRGRSPSPNPGKKAPHHPGSSPTRRPQSAVRPVIVAGDENTLSQRKRNATVTFLMDEGPASGGAAAAACAKASANNSPGGGNTGAAAGSRLQQASVAGAASSNCNTRCGAATDGGAVLGLADDPELAGRVSPLIAAGRDIACGGVSSSSGGEDEGEGRAAGRRQAPRAAAAAGTPGRLPSHKSLPCDAAGVGTGGTAIPLPPVPGQGGSPSRALPAAKGGPCEPGLWVLRRTGNVRSKYLLADQLGRGQFGAVCVAMDKATGDRYACKSVSKRRVQVEAAPAVLRRRWW
jgi:hypothetical protein